jgi:glycerol-3-phosphate acyltransferase PlsY
MNQEASVYVDGNVPYGIVAVLNALGYLLLFIPCYLIGSIPFGYLLVKLSGGGDIRKTGSGNIGATNVLRAGKKGLAILTLILDFGKGALPVIFVNIFEPSLAPLAGFAAVIGHMYPVWLKFKGGKGVATSLGVLMALAWPVALVAMAIWLVTAFLFRYSSLSALVAAAFAPVLAFAFGYGNLVWLLVAMSVLIYIKHIPNIRRLLNGTESKINLKKNDAAPPA